VLKRGLAQKPKPKTHIKPKTENTFKTKNQKTHLKLKTKTKFKTTGNQTDGSGHRIRLKTEDPGSNPAKV
jgi:hypothetical protein